MLDHAFRWFDEVLFYSDKKNFRSQKAVEKIGDILKSGRCCNYFFSAATSNPVPVLLSELKSININNKVNQSVAK